MPTVTQSVSIRHWRNPTTDEMPLFVESPLTDALFIAKSLLLAVQRSCLELTAAIVTQPFESQPSQSQSSQAPLESDSGIRSATGLSQMATEFCHPKTSLSQPATPISMRQANARRSVVVSNSQSKTPRVQTTAIERKLSAAGTDASNHHFASRTWNGRWYLSNYQAGLDLVELPTGARISRSNRPAASMHGSLREVPLNEARQNLISYNPTTTHLLIRPRSLREISRSDKMATEHPANV
jgi:hypothetical protein